MSRQIIYKLLFLAALTLAGLFVSIPSFYKTAPAWLTHLFPTSGMRLGLDLQGGMQLILRVDVDKAVQNSLNLAVQDLRQALTEKQIPVKGIETVGPNQTRVILPTAASLQAVESILQQDFPNLQVISSRAAEAGTYLDVGLQTKQIPAIEESAVSQNVEIIRNRIDQFGVTEPVIVRQGSRDIVVQLPGIKNTQRAIALIGKTAQLEFKLVDNSTQIDLPGLISNAIQSGKLKPNFSHADLNRALQGEIPDDD